MQTEALLIAFRRRNGVKEMLFLHSAHKHYFTLPGGQVYGHKDAEAALEHHLAEQLSALPPKIKPIGRVNGHTPDGRIMHVHLFTGEYTDAIHALTDEGQLEWLDKSRAHMYAGRLPTIIFDKIFAHLESLELW